MVGYVVNRHGALHSVPDDMMEALLRQGFRQATAEEIARWYAAQGLPAPEESAHGQEQHADADQPAEAGDQRQRRRVSR